MHREVTWRSPHATKPALGLARVCQTRWDPLWHAPPWLKLLLSSILARGSDLVLIVFGTLSESEVHWSLACVCQPMIESKDNHIVKRELIIVYWCICVYGLVKIFNIESNLPHTMRKGNKHNKKTPKFTWRWWQVTATYFPFPASSACRRKLPAIEHSNEVRSISILVTFERIKLPAKLLHCFFSSNKPTPIND